MAITQFSRREKAIALVTVALALLYFISMFLVPLVRNRFDVLNKAIAKNEMELRKNLRILAQKDSVKLEYEKYAGLFRQTKSDEQEMASLLSEIETVAREAAIRVTNMKPQALKAGDLAKRFAVNIEVEATLGEIARFIYALQSKPHLLSIEGIRIENRSSRSALLKGYFLVTRDLIP